MRKGHCAVELLLQSISCARELLLQSISLTDQGTKFSSAVARVTCNSCLKAAATLALIRESGFRNETVLRAHSVAPEAVRME